jgi:hypothetical protein
MQATGCRTPSERARRQQAVADEFGNLLPDVDDEDDDGLRGVPAIVPV